MNGALDYKIWEPYKSLLPIPEEEISNNSAQLLPKTPAIKFLT